jgi:Ran-binding protein 9/10
VYYQPPRLLASDLVERIEVEGCRAWSLEMPTHPGFSGRVLDPGASKDGAGVARVITNEGCQDTSILSTFPILGGLYDVGGKARLTQFIVRDTRGSLFG